MDGNRFDSMSRALGAGRSRRSVLRGLAGTALGAVGLARFGTAEAAKGGNSACAAFCAAVFGDTKAAGQCTSQAAKGTGPCVQCGGNAANYCNGGCTTNYQTDPTNCGGCGTVCDTTTSTCQGGSCVPRCTGVVCTGLNTECTVGVCTPATGTCAAEGANEDGTCTTEEGAAGTCTTGTCVANPVTCPECWHEENGQCVLNERVNGCLCCFTNTGGICVPDLPVDHDGDGCVCGFYKVGGICVPNPPQP